MLEPLRHGCANHPDIEGRRRCFQCKRWFCKACYFLRDRRVFCSEQCYSAYGDVAETTHDGNPIKAEPSAPEIAAPIADCPFEEFPIPHAAPMEPGLSRRQIKTILIIAGGTALACVAGLFVGVFLLWRTHAEMRQTYDSLRAEQKRLRYLTEQLMARTGMQAGHDRPVIQSPPSQARLSRRTIEVSGQYKHAQPLLLIVNGAVRDTGLSQQGQFTFRGVRLREGQNVIAIKALLFGSKAISSEPLEIVFGPSADTARAIPKGDLPDYSFNRGNPANRTLALTFDSDSYANAAPEILDILRSRGVKATFFLTGRFIRRSPNIVKLILADGHEIGNHTNNHPHLTSYYKDGRQTLLPDATFERLAKELREADAALMHVAGRPISRCWRSPYGDYNRTLCDWGRAAGYTHVGWTSYGSWRTNMDTNDWIPNENEPGYKTPQEVVDKILRFGAGTPHEANGGIILMHLGTARQDPEQQVHRSLEKIIDGMRAKEYRFVTVSEMIQESGTK